MLSTVDHRDPAWEYLTLVIAPTVEDQMHEKSPQSQARYTVDLHSHSTFSDGSLTPTALVALAAKRGVKVLALTDHDTLAGVPEAQAAATPLGIEIVTGVEISAWHEREVHVLGYFVDLENEALQRATARLSSGRRDRLIEIGARLRALDVHVDIEHILATHPGNVGRPQVADALVRQGVVENFEAAFSEYLGADGSAYVPAARMTVEEAARLIHQAGGIAALAHPGAERLFDAIPSLAKLGLDALECDHPAHRAGTARRFRRRARHFGLGCTGGSDFHHLAYSAELGSHGMTMEGLDLLRARCPQNARIESVGA